MSGAVQAAMRDGHAEIRSERAGRNYRFDLTRIGVRRQKHRHGHPRL